MLFGCGWRAALALVRLGSRAAPSGASLGSLIHQSLFDSALSICKKPPSWRLLLALSCQVHYASRITHNRQVQLFDFPQPVDARLLHAQYVRF